MNPRTLVLGSLLLILCWVGVWVGFSMGVGVSQRGSLQRDVARSQDPSELSWGELAERELDPDLEAALDALDSPYWREDAGETNEDEAPARDDLFADSPAPPEPGAYDGALVREFHESGGLLFDAEQSRREDGVWVVDGRWNSYHENGQVQESGFYEMGVEAGDWSWWDDNGQKVAIGTFVAGEREGAWTFWYEDGTKQMDARYEGGQGAGNWMLYYEDGTPWAQGQYVDGEISGYWTIWDEFGEVNPERSGMYEHGERISD